MNATKISKTGAAATFLILNGLEVNAEIALEEPEMVQEVDQAILDLVNRFGLNSVLASIHDAAWSAGEVHADGDDELETLASVRLKLFSSRLGDAMATLK